MKGTCPDAGPDCPYFNRATPGNLKDTQEHGCYTDIDHKVPRFMGKGACALVRNFIKSRANLQPLCRNKHDAKTKEEWENPPELPDDRFMIDALIRVRNERRLCARQSRE